MCGVASLFLQANHLSACRLSDTTYSLFGRRAVRLHNSRTRKISRGDLTVLQINNCDDTRASFLNQQRVCSGRAGDLRRAPAEFLFATHQLTRDKRNFAEVLKPVSMCHKARINVSPTVVTPLILASRNAL